MIRDLIATIVALGALLVLASAAAATIWPPDPHPLVISVVLPSKHLGARDAKAPGCPGLRPLPRNGGPPPPPLSDTRRIA